MSLSDLASIGSFVGGAAVVVSFLFLGLQIRQGNRNQRVDVPKRPDIGKNYAHSKTLSVT